MKRDYWSIIFLIIIAGFGVACTQDVSESLIKMRGDIIGATGFPRVTGALLALLCVAAVLRIVLRPGTEAESMRLSWRAWLLVVASSAYIVGISYIGFAISTFCYLLAAAFLYTGFNKQRARGIIIYSVAVTLISYFFFKTFKVYLPDTILF